jgi:sugar phosphate isomerase/epimerase
MKIGLYSITYRGVWYKGDAIDVFGLVRLAREMGFEGLELDAERPHAAPMDLSADDRKRLRDLAGETGIPICAISPNCDLSSPVPVQRDAMICYTRECIRLARDLGAPICKISPRGAALRSTTDLPPTTTPTATTSTVFWKADRRQFVVDAVRELAKVAEDHGVMLAMQNHGPDIAYSYQDVLSMIAEVGSPAFKACMDINIEAEADSPEHAEEMARASGPLQVHSHCNGEFGRTPDGAVELIAGGYFDNRFWGRKVAYPAYVRALVAAGYDGYIDWEFCHPARSNGRAAGIDYIHDQTRMAIEYLRALRAEAVERTHAVAAR